MRCRRSGNEPIAITFIDQARENSESDDFNELKIVHAKSSQSFFRPPATDLAPALIGKILVWRIHGKALQGAHREETEAYLGPGDLASHASKGRTRRTEVPVWPRGPGLRVLDLRDVCDMLNVVAGGEGEAQAVLIRAAKPLNGWKADLFGARPAYCAFEITCTEHGLDLTGGQLYFLDDPAYRARVVSAKRVGIDYAREWKDAPLRFLDADHPARDCR